MKPNLKTLSTFLSLVLRHQPDIIRLHLDAGGWADIEDLVARANAHGTPLTRDLVLAIVATSDKQRFRIDETGTRIRANQGHSIPVDLGLVPRTPPPRLYHGTATRFLASILAEGLLPRERQHVHLSAQTDTALTVGARHGRPVILEIDAAVLHQTGHPFFCSENGVWLTPSVPPAALKVLPSPA